MAVSAGRADAGEAGAAVSAGRAAVAACPTVAALTGYVAEVLAQAC